MKAQCLPFQKIPQSTRLFLDYLCYVPTVRSLYPRSPDFSGVGESGTGGV